VLTTKDSLHNAILILVLATIIGLFGGRCLAAEDEWDGELSALHNTFVRLTNDKSLKIVVIGNSVAHGSIRDGKPVNFYSYVRDWFKATFRDVNIEVKTGIIFAIGPELQLFKMEEKVFHENPDLVLVEFGAANGAWGKAGKEITERATEGYIRRLRFVMPRADCIMNMGLFRTMLDTYRAGRTPPSVLFQRRVAGHYRCAPADSQKELVRRILGGDAWKTYMGDVIHPNARGYEIHGQVLTAELERQYVLFQGTPQRYRKLRDHTLPSETVHDDPWLFPRLVPAYFADPVNGFTIRENGRLKYIAADKAGANGSFEAKRGRIVGMLMRSPGKCGNVEVRADGGEWARLSHRREPRFTDEADPANLLQRFFFAAYGLPLYCDRIDFRVSADPETDDAYDVRIVGFMVIERKADLPFSRDGG